MKVLVLYNYLFHYRIPIFRLLAKFVDLTVAYSFGEGFSEDLNFDVIKIPAFRFGRFVYQMRNLKKICNSFDVIIVYGDIAWLKYSTLPFRKKRNYKVIFWSPGVSASYTKKFDEMTKWDAVRDYFYKKADALIFYTEYPISKYIRRGFSREKLFVARNTVEVKDNNKYNIEKKDSILFIGTLYMQKGILFLLNSYYEAYKTCPNLLPLNIIGGGKELNKVMEWIEKRRLGHKVFVIGPVYDDRRKSDFFSKAFACISPVQAGLSVLESFGYGVPFVTMTNALTGGERLNIQNGYNGILLQNLSELTNSILDISKNRDKYIQMGARAKKYYSEKAKPIDMVKGILQAIDFVRQ